MKYYMGCDAHKKYSVFTAINEAGEITPAKRVEHDRNSFRSFLKTLPPASPIAVESTGNWYWLIDEMEKAGHVSSLVHAAKAKLMMGHINKTDELDAQGLAILARNGTLPAVWIPPGELRDRRELPRMRMALSQVGTKFKNRIHSTFAKYGITFDEVSDLFGKKGRILIEKSLDELPPETKNSVQEQLWLLDQLEQSINKAEKRIREVIKIDHDMQLLLTLPGVGPILTIVIALEVGIVDRFPTGERLTMARCVRM
jgi:transposase